MAPERSSGRARPSRDRVARRRTPGRASTRRIRLIAVVGLALLGVLAARATFLGVVQAGQLGELAERQRQADFEIPAPRGTILTRDGRELAVDRPAVNVSATPYLVEDPAAVAAQIGPAIGRDPNELVELLASGDGYALLARDVPPEAAKRAEALELEAIDFVDTYARELPRGPNASQVVGLTDNDRAGITGVELQLQDLLAGRPGHRVEARDPFGRPLEVLSARDAVPGDDVRLSIDGPIQERAERVLAETVEELEATSAMALVMRPSDGAILAMANVPSFDPTERTLVDAGLARNRVVADVFEPGSTFKIVTVSGALEEGVVEPETRFDLRVELRTGDTRGQEFERVLRDAHEREAINASVASILRDSSNIGTVLIAQQLERPRLEAWIERFGFLAPTGVDFPGEVAGLAPDWSPVSITNVPIGQGIGVNLVQLASAYATIANGGYAVTPHLVESVGGTPAGEEPGERILSAETAAEVGQMLRDVVDLEGAGARAAVPGYEVAGKTGTAQKVDPETGEYSNELYVSSFVGYVPADRPELLIAVVVDEPGEGLYYGGDVAAPDFEEIAEYSLQRLGIAP